MRWTELMAALRLKWARRRAVRARKRCDAELALHRKRWVALSFDRLLAEERYEAAVAARNVVKPEKPSEETPSVLLC